MNTEYNKESGLPVTIKTFEFNELMLDSVIRELSNVMGISAFHEFIGALSCCVQELVDNAERANSQRIYFIDNSLDVNDPKQYEIGIKKFEEEYLLYKDYFVEKRKKLGLYVTVSFKNTGDSLIVKVNNSVLATRQEHLQFYDRIIRSRLYRNFDEAIVDLFKPEKPGLGIVFVVFLLKQIGLDEDSLTLESVGKETFSLIKISFAKLNLKRINKLRNIIYSDIKSLSNFPESIICLQDIIDKSDTKLADVSDWINQDPSLTEGFLDLINSVRFMVPHVANNVSDAVKMIGLRKLRNLIFSFAVQKTLNERYGTDQVFWEHAIKVAFWGYKIIENKNEKRLWFDTIYLGCILHDIGKILVNSRHPKLLVSLRCFASRKRLPFLLLETLFIGFDHAMIGGFIAEKWDFSETIVSLIKHHHKPVKTTESSEIQLAIYLANAMCGVEKNLITFEDIDQQALKTFSILSEKKFQCLQKEFQTIYNKRKRKS